MSNPTMRECNTPAELSAFLNLTKNYRYMGDRMIYRETGCLIPCQRVMTRTLTSIPGT